MTKEDYKKYLISSKWLIKKAELVNYYLKMGYEINCFFCLTSENLQVHHFSYKNIGNEIIDGENHWEITFVCRSCHEKYHKNKNFREDFRLWPMYKLSPAGEEISDELLKLLD